MTGFVNEHMTPAEQVEYAWQNRVLFDRCGVHNYRVLMRRMRNCSREGRYIYGWDADAEKLLAQAALNDDT